mmetsp:Transcript_28810/g.94150  ORF Transcript_28810/g.94150 Transcript_28810/m.94150 type:complete len:201 (+) Transcript_28810:115-717(+)
MVRERCVWWAGSSAILVRMCATARRMRSIDPITVTMRSEMPGMSWSGEESLIDAPDSSVIQRIVCPPLPMMAPHRTFGTRSRSCNPSASVPPADAKVADPSSTIFVKMRCIAASNELTEPVSKITRSVVPGKHSFARDNWIRTPVWIWYSLMVAPFLPMMEPAPALVRRNFNVRSSEAFSSSPPRSSPCSRSCAMPACWA